MWASGMQALAACSSHDCGLDHCRSLKVKCCDPGAIKTSVLKQGEQNLAKGLRQSQLPVRGMWGWSCTHSSRWSVHGATLASYHPMSLDCSVVTGKSVLAISGRVCIPVTVDQNVRWLQSAVNGSGLTDNTDALRSSNVPLVPV